MTIEFGEQRPTTRKAEGKVDHYRWYLLAVIALLAVGTVAATWPSKPAVANSCANQCRAQHSQCRIATKGSASCDSALAACLSACLRR